MASIAKFPAGRGDRALGHIYNISRSGGVPDDIFREGTDAPRTVFPHIETGRLAVHATAERLTVWHFYGRVRFQLNHRAISR